jgi:hypothetical protein
MDPKAFPFSVFPHLWIDHPGEDQISADLLDGGLSLLIFLHALYFFLLCCSKVAGMDQDWKHFMGAGDTGVQVQETLEGRGMFTILFCYSFSLTTVSLLSFLIPPFSLVGAVHTKTVIERGLRLEAKTRYHDTTVCFGWLGLFWYMFWVLLLGCF